MRHSLFFWQDLIIIIIKEKNKIEKKDLFFYIGSREVTSTPRRIAGLVQTHATHMFKVQCDTGIGITLVRATSVPHKREDGERSEKT